VHLCWKFLFILKVGPLTHFDYPTKLSIVGLSTLKTRRTRGDLIQLFKYYTIFDALNLPNAPALGKSSTRGHRFQVFTEHCLHNFRKDSVGSSRTNWNRLPDTLMNANFASLLQ